MQLHILELLLPVCLSIGCASAPAAPVPVLFPEGSLHGFVVLKDMAGAVLAYGDQVETVRGSTLNSKMTFHFPDGSFFEEQVTFTQTGVFRMLRYSLISRGPSFEKDQQIVIDTQDGRYRFERRTRGRADSEIYEGKIKLPDDIYNGMVMTIAKNLAKQPSSRVHFVAFTPKPRIVEIDLTTPDSHQVLLGETPRPAMHFVVKPKLNIVEGTVAKMLDKVPPDSHIWIVTDDVPGFVRAETTIVPDGPLWRIELAVPRWQDVPGPATREQGK
jgi:hypothetical protein